jgi:protein SCO1
MRLRLVVFGTAAAAAVIGGAALIASRQTARVPALPFYVDSTLTPVWTADTAAVPRVRAFSLVDQNGHAVNEVYLNGHITVVTFFYATCKDLCPRLQSRLAAVRSAFADDPRLQLASISIAPEHDTSAVLAAYAAANHIVAPQWLLLTGKRAEIDRIAQRSFFVTTPLLRSADSGPTTHGETIWLLDQSRRIRGLYNGTMPLDTKRLMEDIATLAGRTQDEKAGKEKEEKVRWRRGG